jgi:hypothetical protein
MIAPSSVFRLNPVVAIEDFGERSLALHCEELRMVELNATARDLIRRLDGEMNLADVAMAMAEAYGQPPEMVLSDAQAVIEQMVALDIVEEVVGKRAG